MSALYSPKYIQLKGFMIEIHSGSRHNHQPIPKESQEAKRKRVAKYEQAAALKKQIADQTSNMDNAYLELQKLLSDIPELFADIVYFCDFHKIGISVFMELLMTQQAKDALKSNRFEVFCENFFNNLLNDLEQCGIELSLQQVTIIDWIIEDHELLNFNGTLVRVSISNRANGSRFQIKREDFKYVSGKKRKKQKQK